MKITITHQFSGCIILLLALIMPQLSMAANTVEVTYTTASGSQTSSSYATINAFMSSSYNTSDISANVKLLADQQLSAELSSSFKELTIDLNNHTINGLYTAYNKTYDLEKDQWVDDLNSPYDAYCYFLIYGKNLTIKNGTVKNTNVWNNSNLNGVLKLDNATIEHQNLQWPSTGGINLTNNSTINLESTSGIGSITLEKLDIDETSKISCKGVNEITTSLSVKGGLKQLMHRLSLPEGYFMKKETKGFVFYSDQTPNQQYGLPNLQFTIDGSTPCEDCASITNTYNKDNYEYSQQCEKCMSKLQYNIISSADNGATYTCDNFVLNDNSYALDFNFTASNFSYPRAVTGGSIVTFILPAEIPVNKINGKVYKFNAYEDNTLCFTKLESEKTEANVPYLVQLNSNATQLLKSGIQNVSVCAANAQSYKIMNQSVSHIGSYTSQTVTSNQYMGFYGYSSASQQFVKASSGTLNPFRTVFSIPNPEYEEVIQLQDWTSTNKGQKNSTSTTFENGANYTFTAKTGDKVVFDYYVDSESYDKLTVYVCNGNATESNYGSNTVYSNWWSGANKSGTATHYIQSDKEATFIFVAEYEKDSSTNSGADLARVTNIYVVKAKTSGSSSKSSIGLRLDDDTTTQIIKVDADKRSTTGSAMYNLNGQRIDNLRKGQIYIQNGKKMINK